MLTDDVRRSRVRFADYRQGERGAPLEAHRVELERGGSSAAPLVLHLESARYNTGLDGALFDPPSESALNIPALLREVERNQNELDRRISEYTFTRKQTEREINDRGEVKKEKTLVHEVYPVEGGGRVLKLISEDGRPLSPERMRKEEQRVGEEIEKAEREHTERKRKREERARKNRGEAGEEGDDDPGVATFLRACEFISPRRELFRGRETIVFDFQPRRGFRPSNRAESLIAKLVGVIWIDPVDRQVIRLEARLADSFKVGGGLLAQVRPGSAIVLEQTRMPDGVWLPRFSQISLAAKLFLFAGFKLNATREYSDYKRFSTKTGDATLDAPKQQP